MISSDSDNAWQADVRVTASLPDGGDNNAPRISDAEHREFLPTNPEVYTYDADGNLTNDGRWLYTWDAENRLISMETLAIAYGVGAPRQKLQFAYDGQGRRFSKKVYAWNETSGLWSQTSALHYLYDGWNLIAELDALNASVTIRNSYIWGLDLSGSQQGAGGVGGLLAVTDSTGSTAYPFYDGNGNVMGYYAAVDGAKVAEFEYGPFGELIRETGAKKDGFNFRFSTKYQDAETGLLYYGFRYYDAETGRWPNRDPIGEQGGINLYGMVGNNSINHWDLLGWKTCKEKITFVPVIESVKDVDVSLTWPSKPEMPPPLGLIDINFLVAASVKGYAKCKKIDTDCCEENKTSPSVSVSVSGIKFTFTVGAGPKGGVLSAVKKAKMLIKGAGYLAKSDDVIAAFTAKAALDKACSALF